MLLLEPDHVKQEERLPLVIGLAQTGKEGFLSNRSEAIAKLLAANCAVLLLDVHGTGETRPGNDRGRGSTDTGRSSSQLMLGSTSVGTRLRDLRSLIAFLRGSKKFDAKRIALWGDSLAEFNADDTNFDVPRRIEGRPRQSEPRLL